MENKKYKYIDKYRIDINILIGKTFYSKVYQGEDIKTNKIVAIKLIDLKYISDNYIFNNLYNQLTNIKTIKSNYLIEIYDIFFSKSYLYIIEEYCKNGNFEIFLSSNSLSEQESINVLSQILFSLKILKENNIINGQVKPTNILLSNSGKWLLSDFFLKNEVFSNTNNFIFSLHKYQSIESLKSSIIDYKSDVWSFGLIMYEILFEKFPFNLSQTKNEYISMIENTNISFETKKRISQEIIVILKKCLDINSNKRPDWENIILRASFRKSIMLQKSRNSFDIDNMCKMILINLQNTIERNKIKIEDLFKRFDSSGDENIDISEFSKLMRVIDKNLAEIEINSVFNKIDFNSKGYINSQDLKKILQENDYSVLDTYEDPLLQAKSEKILYVLKETIQKNKIDLNNLFQNYDNSGDLNLDYKEFEKMVKDISPTIKEIEAQYLFATLDYDKSGGINLKEFKSFILEDNKDRLKVQKMDRNAIKTLKTLRHIIYTQMIDIKKLFEKFDEQNRGKLNLKEFSEMIKILNNELDIEEISFIFKKIDIDGSGYIDHKEFLEKLN